MGNNGAATAIAYITCCQTINVDLECVTVWSGTVTDHYHAIYCPSTDYFMTGCSGYNKWSANNGWYIVDGNGGNPDYCVARQAGSGGDNWGVKNL